MPQIGDYMVTATGGWIGWCIRAVTKSTVNHAAVYVGAGFVIEAQAKWFFSGNVEPAPVSKYPNAIWAERDLTWGQRFAIRTNAHDLVGTPYNYLDIAAQAVVRLFGWHAPKWALRRLARNDRLQCAQLVDVCYERAGIHLFRNLPEGLVAPSDLLDLIEAKHG